MPLQPSARIAPTCPAFFALPVAQQALQVALEYRRDQVMAGNTQDELYYIYDGYHGFYGALRAQDLHTHQVFLKPLQLTQKTGTNLDHLLLQRVLWLLR